MGIRGLSTFFDNNSDLSKLFRLHDTEVVIDGDNLLHVLYFRSKLDCTYGGDYQKYANSIKKYLSSFLRCNIRPIVIFDGGHDISGRKFSTNIYRLKTRLSTTQHISKYGQCSSSFLPIAARVVFRDVLSEMGIRFAQCDFEADDQVTYLANHYKCPVISDDSDFYIFDVQNGFIRLSSIDAKVLEVNENGVKFRFLSCSMYYIDEFLSYFPGINRNVLPLFGTLIGNDYSKSGAFEKFFSNIKLPKKGKCLKVSQGHRKIVGLLSWLSHNDLNEGINTVLSFLKKDQREHFRKIIQQSIDGYKLSYSPLTYVVDGNIDALKQFLSIKETLKTQCGHSLPIQFLANLFTGKLPPCFINAIFLHRLLLPAQVEVPSLLSSYVCSRYIRQVIYGILLQHTTQDSETHLNECLRSVEEYDRRNSCLKRELLEPIFALRNGRAIPELGVLYSLGKDDCLQILLDVLGTEYSALSGVPEDWQLIFACVTYFLKNSDPKPKEDFLYAFAINIIYFQILQKPIPTNATKRNRFKQTSIGVFLDGITTQETDFAAGNLKKYIETPNLNRGNPLFLSIVHGFSQFQTCLLYAVHLNRLLNLPFSHPKLDEIVEGTMMYNLSKDISNRRCPDLFVSELLGRQSKLVDFFLWIKNKLCEGVPEDCIERVDRTDIRPKKKSKKRSRQKVEKPISDSESESRNSPEERIPSDDFSEVYI